MSPERYRTALSDEFYSNPLAQKYARRDFHFKAGRTMKISSIVLRWLLLVAVATALSGCFYIGRDDYDDIIAKPATGWSTRDALTVMMACAGHNLFDVTSPNIKVIATPYYPSVILASTRVWEDRRHIAMEEVKSTSEEIARSNAGLYIDWAKNQFVDSRGNYFKGPLQLDSLMFFIHLENNGWRNATPSFNGTPLWNPNVFPCYVPDITDLEQRIFLVNGKNKFIKPKYVWGRRQNQFAMPEDLLAMFALRNEGHHFLEGSTIMYLVIKGFDADVKLAYDLSMIR